MRPLAFALLLAGALAPLRAETTPSDAKPEKSGKTASFRFVSLVNPGALCARVSKEKCTRVNIGLGFIGSPVRLPVASGITLLRDQAARPGDTPKPGEAACTFAPQAEPRQLILISAGPENTLVAHAMPDTEKGFPYGGTMLMNLTRFPLTLSLNGEKTVAAPMKKVLCAHRRPTGPGAADLPVRVTLPQEGGGEKLVYSTVWPYAANVRTLVFAVEGPDGLIEIRPVTDVDSPALREAPDKNAKDDAKKKTGR